MTAPCTTDKPRTAGECGSALPILAYFADMIDHCLDYATAAHAQGRPIVGIMCEFTPREIIMAAGGVPVCLCGGSAATIPDAEQCLPSNLCPLIKSTFGYAVRKSNPFLNMASLVVAETTCDGKKKMFELMAESWPLYVLQLPHRADDPAALEAWVGELRKFKAHLEKRFNTAITDERLRSAIEVMNRERSLRRQLAELMALQNPPLSGRELLSLKSIISGVPADLQQYETALKFLQAQAQAGNRHPSGQVRVLMTGVPMVHGAERVLELIESCGGLVVCQENCTGLKPLLEDVDETAEDPLEAIARKYYHLPCSVMSLNQRRTDTLAELAGTYRPDCVIELVWQACLTYDVESFYVRRWAEGMMNLPYYRISTDYSPSDSARIRARVEALFEVARGRRTPSRAGVARET